MFLFSRGIFGYTWANKWWWYYNPPKIHNSSTTFWSYPVNRNGRQREIVNPANQSGSGENSLPVSSECRITVEFSSLYIATFYCCRNNRVHRVVYTTAARPKDRSRKLVTTTLLTWFCFSLGEFINGEQQLLFACKRSAMFMVFVNFYRATLCVSAVFAVVRCPSVCHVRAFYPDGVGKICDIWLRNKVTTER